MEEESQQPNLWNWQRQNQRPEEKSQIIAAKIPSPHIESSDKPIRPKEVQVEKLRLILSTYQDGTGMLMKGEKNLPGWRDFERAVALAFGGKTQESKHVFDVIVPAQNGESSYGISCKMRGELSKSIDRTSRDGRALKGRVSMEMSNAAKYFWTTIKAQGIDEETFKDRPVEAGIALINLVKSWHNTASLEGINLAKSYYLTLEWDGKGNEYQLFQYSLDLPDPEKLNWHFPVIKSKSGEEKTALHLSGNDGFGTNFEWYSSSGGQLKYYPLTIDALWHSDKFQLEPLPKLDDLEFGIISKARTYFPLKWNTVSK